MNLVKNLSSPKTQKRKKRKSSHNYIIFLIVLLLMRLTILFAPSSVVKLMWTSPIEYIHDSICYMQKPAHFEYSGVSFDYPKTLNATKKPYDNMKEIVNLYGKSNAHYIIFYAEFFRMNDSGYKKITNYTDEIEVNIHPNQTIEEAIKKINPYTYRIKSSKDIIIDEKNATSVFLNSKTYYGIISQIEKIFIQNGNDVYVFELKARQDRFEKDKKDFDKIIQSIKFK